jgi:uncharacterized membrane protein YkvA (DUF1232 family)
VLRAKVLVAALLYVLDPIDLLPGFFSIHRDAR